MVDAVGSLLNNAVDIYVQAVDYCRISTSQIPTPVGAGIRQIKPESGDVWQMSLDSEGYHSRFRPELRLSRRIPARIRPERRRSGHLAGEAGSSQNGQTLGIWPDSGNFCRNMYMPNIKKYFYIL
jgi:hypothetical protein